MESVASAQQLWTRSAELQKKRDQIAVSAHFYHNYKNETFCFHSCFPNFPFEMDALERERGYREGAQQFGARKKDGGRPNLQVHKVNQSLYTMRTLITTSIFLYVHTQVSLLLLLLLQLTQTGQKTGSLVHLILCSQGRGDALLG